MNRRKGVVTSLVLAAVFAASVLAHGGKSVGAATFADPAFEAVWQRTDALVASGQVKRSFYWGPAPLQAQMEPYAQGQAGKRLVQYFDKSRMEINNPAGDKNSPFYVTNGLLTVELVTGWMQVGDAQYVDRYPAQIPLASDSDDPSAPTYATFGKVMQKADSNLGKAKPQAIDKGANITPASVQGYTAEQTIAYYEPATGHNIPRVFWDFLNATGPVLQDGKTVTARLNDPWFYAAGLPISEAYWAKAKIAGKLNTDVYVQAYQRRVLTFVPSAPEGFRVQVGNIGLHYYDWRYKNAGQGTATPGSGSGRIAVSGAVKTPMTLDGAALTSATAVSVKVSFTEAGGTESHTYKGPLLLDLLKAAGGQGNGGRDLPIRYIVATGQGGRRAVLSWGEIDPIFAGKQIIVAYEQDGVKLGGAQGPARLVIPSDKSGVRSLYGLSSLEVRTVTPTTPTGTMLKITGAVQKPLSLTAQDLPSRNPQTVQVRYMAGGVTESHTYKGVSLLQLLTEAGAANAKTQQADLAGKYVVASGRDGRNAVLSWGEFDPSFSGTNVLVAYEENGVPLGGGTTRLVVPSDARGGRYLTYLLSLDVRNAAP